MTALSEKLKSLGVRVGARDLPPPRSRNPYPIELIAPGDFWQTPQGEVYVVETSYPLDTPHRDASLRVEGSLEAIAQWAGDSRLAQAHHGGFAFLDTETTGLAGGTGTYAFLVGVARVEGETFRLAQFFMRDPVEEPALLAGVAEFLEPCQALVTFNGKGFDVPLLDARYIINGDDSPLASLAHLDLLPLARRLWRDRLPSRALGYLEEHVLGVVRAEEDVPGWVIPSLYFNYLRDGDARPLKGVFYHNAIDVLSLAALLSHIAEMFEDPLDGKGIHSLDLVAMGKLFEGLGQLKRATQLYRLGLEAGLSEDAYWATLQRLSFAHKRRKNYPAAIVLWREAAGGGHLYAHVELAKFYEHKARDYHEAAAWTRRAITLVNESHLSPYARREQLAELEHRLARLQRKLNQMK